MSGSKIDITSLLTWTGVGILFLAFTPAAKPVREFGAGLFGSAATQAVHPKSGELRAEGASPALGSPLQANELQELSKGLRAYLLHRDPKAIPIIGKYALMGEPRAQSLVASMYIQGDGLPLDREEGVRWLRLAAAQGGQAEQDYLIAVTNAISENGDSASPSQRYNQTDRDHAADPGLAASRDGTQNVPKAVSASPHTSLEAAPLPLIPIQRRASGLDGPSASREFLERELASPSRVGGGSTVILNRAGPGTYAAGNGDIYAQAGPYGVVNTRTGEFSPTN